MDEARAGVLRLSESSELGLSFAPELGWHPVRHLLGITAFGMNAYTCHAEGGQLIEEHDELGDAAGGHEEVYVVVAGHAVFTLDGEKVDAPAGTIVAVHDPSVRRAARALTAGTTALAVGGAPGRPFEVSKWEYAFRADAEARRGRLPESITIVGEALQRWPDDAMLLYNLACFESLAGRGGEALTHLRRSVDLDPKYAGYAADDADLDAIRGEPGFPAPPA
jgi:tetratricopeptide (TPR) repeat protein